MDFFEEHLQINKLLIQELHKSIMLIDDNIQFYQKYYIDDGKCKVEVLKKRKQDIENIILLYKTTGKIH
jgi:hypothetical protein